MPPISLPLDDLTERVKEQRCIHAVAKAIANEATDLQSLMTLIAAEMKAAMLDPDDAAVEVLAGAERAATEGFDAQLPGITAASGSARLMVVYRHSHANLDRGPFLEEEIRLAEAVCRLLDLFVSRSQARDERDTVLANARRLASVQERSPAVAFVWRLSEGWPVEYVSANVRLFGYEAEEFLSGKLRYDQIIHPDDVPHVTEEVRRHMAAGHRSFRLSYRIVARSGDIRWVEDHTAVLNDETGAAEYNQGIIVDVTERVLAEERARRYLMAAGGMLTVLDADGRLTMVNDRTCVVTGRSEGELLGLDWNEMFTLPEDRADARARFLAIVANPESGTAGEYESEFLTGGGDRRRIHWNYSVTQQPDGSFENLIVFGTDVSDRHELQQKAEAFASLPRENPNPVLRVDVNGDVILANVAAQALVDNLANADDSDVTNQQRDAWRSMIVTASRLESRASVALMIGTSHFLFILSPVPHQAHTNIYGIEDTETWWQRNVLESLAGEIPGVFFDYVLMPDSRVEIPSMFGEPRGIWGLTGEELSRKPELLFRGATGDETERVHKGIDESARTLRPWADRWHVLGPGGALRCVQASARPQRRADGATVWHTLLLDITEEVQRQDVLADIASNVPGVFFQAIRRADGTDAITNINGDTEGVWEIPAAELEGDPAPVWAMIHPEDVSAVRDSVARSARDLKPWSAMWRVVPKSGVVRWLRGTGNPRRLPNGDTLWNTLILDISEQARSREIIDAFFEQPVNLHVIAQLDRTILRLNRGVETILGLDPTDLTGSRLDDLVHADDRQAMIDAVGRSAGSRLAEFFEARCRSRDAGLRILAWSVILRGDYLFAVAADVTQQRAIEAHAHRLAELRTLVLRCQRLILEASREEALLALVAGELNSSFHGCHVSFRPASNDDAALDRTGAGAPSAIPNSNNAADATPAGALAFPVHFKATTVLAMVVEQDPDSTLDENDMAALTEVADNVTLGVTSLRSQEDRLAALGAAKEAALDTIRAISTIIEQRDAYTAGHQEGVVRIATAAARELGWNEDRIEGLRLAAQIHDIGKIAMPAEILNRPGRLSDAQMALIKGHAQAGADILEGIAFAWPIRDIILQHHERMDGSGYPNGIAGDAILPESRIIAVADVLEAMTNHRPYRPALGIEAARNQLLADRGTKLDPEAVDACLSAIAKDTDGILLGH